MLKRKILTLIFAPILSILFITFWASDGLNKSDIFQVAYGISMIALPFLLLYGLPVSLLAEKVPQHLSNSKRLFISFLVHIFFGLSFIYIFSLLFNPHSLIENFGNNFKSNYPLVFAATLTSVLFWITDEILRLIFKERNQINK